MELHICTNRDNRGSRIHWDSSQHSHSLLALLLPSSASPPICSYSFSDDNVSREARRSKWHRENGKKGKGNNTLQKKPHYWGLLLSEFSKGSPFPSSICLSCTLEAVTQKLCLLLPAPAAKVWGQLWGPGTAWFMNSKKRVLLEPASGSQRPRKKELTNHSFHAGQVLSALLDVWVIFCCFIMKCVPKVRPLLSQTPLKFFVKVIALGHMFMYWPVSLLPLWWKCIT